MAQARYKGIAASVLLVPLLFPAPIEASSGKPPFLMLQICLGDQKNLEVFENVLRSIADSEHLNIADTSLEVERDLGALNKTNPNVPHNHPTVNISIYSNDNAISLGATNIGLSTYEVAVGFADTPETASKARAFSMMVVAKLSSLWQVTTIPRGMGALPAKTCDLSLDKK